MIAIELDGVGHDREEQNHRDAVKDVSFHSAQLRVVRLREVVRQVFAPLTSLPVES